MKQMLWIGVISIVCVLTCLPTAYGSETWFSIKSENLGQFLTRVGDRKYAAVSFPTEDGLILKQTTYCYQASTAGDWKIGWQQRTIFELKYNLPAAEFVYYFLKKEPLPNTYTSINWDMLEYTRRDLLFDLTCSPFKHWQLSLGGRIVSAEDLNRFKVMEAQASQIEDALSRYDLYGYTTLWLANQQVGYGSSYALDIHYTPTPQFSFYLTGDDLFGRIHWQGISMYHGVIDLDVVKPDDEGLDSIHPPIRGNEYTHNATLSVWIPPDLRGGITFRAGPVQIDSWLRHHGFWEAGITGTYDLPQLPSLTLGCVYRDGTLLYHSEVNTGYFGLRLTLNRMKAVTDATFGINVHLY